MYRQRKLLDIIVGTGSSWQVAGKRMMKRLPKEGRPKISERSKKPCFSRPAREDTKGRVARNGGEDDKVQGGVGGRGDEAGATCVCLSRWDGKKCTVWDARLLF